MAQAIPNVPHPQSTRRPWPPVTGKQNSASVASGKAMSLEKNVRGYGLKTIVVAVSLAVTIGIIGFRTVSAAPPQRAQVIQAERDHRKFCSGCAEDPCTGHSAL